MPEIARIISTILLDPTQSGIWALLVQFYKRHQSRQSSSFRYSKKCVKSTPNFQTFLFLYTSLTGYWALHNFGKSDFHAF